MPTSQPTLLSKPTGDGKLHRAALAYVLKRGRQKAYDLIVSEFKKSGISQTTLARRLGKGPDQISRLFRRPSNIEIDTLAAVLFALNGGAPRYDVEFPSAQKGFSEVTQSQSLVTSNSTVDLPAQWTAPLRTAA